VTDSVRTSKGAEPDLIESRLSLRNHHQDSFALSCERSLNTFLFIRPTSPVTGQPNLVYRVRVPRVRPPSRHFHKPGVLGGHTLYPDLDFQF